MEAVKVILLDLTNGPALGSSLRQILESSPKPRIHIQELPGASGESPGGNTLSETLGNSPYHLLFVLLPSDHILEMKHAVKYLVGRIERPILIVLEANETEQITELLKLGVSDFLVPPLRKLDVLPRLWRALRKNPAGDVSSPRKTPGGLGQMIGRDASFLAEMAKIQTVADCRASVLILGETGTGKELCARAIHELGPRSNRPFVALNCGAIPAELMENELFGHVKGAFTGASKAFPGLIHAADGGTLFLDEIDCLSLQAQVKLLRFLQDNEYRRLGSTKTLRADVRVLAASNVDLERAAVEGAFRRDLLYRINIFALKLPPLQNRSGDIPLLAKHFLEMYTGKYQKPARDFSADAIQKLMNYSWPGNIRELENIVECAVVFCPNAVICGSDLALPDSEYAASESLRSRKSRVIAEFEKKYIRDLLIEHNGNISRAARAAQKNRRAFWELIRKHHIEAPKSGEPANLLH